VLLFRSTGFKIRAVVSPSLSRSKVSTTTPHGVLYLEEFFG
jgi:hypothetical protein